MMMNIEVLRRTIVLILGSAISLTLVACGGGGGDSGSTSSVTSTVSVATPTGTPTQTIEETQDEVVEMPDITSDDIEGVVEDIAEVSPFDNQDEVKSEDGC